VVSVTGPYGRILGFLDSLSLVSTTEELLDRKVAAHFQEMYHASILGSFFRLWM
jgi:hypothetical protein